MKVEFVFEDDSVLEFSDLRELRDELTQRTILCSIKRIIADDLTKAVQFRIKDDVNILKEVEIKNIRQTVNYLNNLTGVSIVY